MSAGQSTSWDDENDDGDDGQRPESNVMKDLRRINSQQAKRLKELEERVAAFDKASRSSTIKGLLESRDLNPKIAAFIPEDVEATQESLDKWIAEYGDVFGAPAPKAPAVDDASLAARRQMDDVGASLQPQMSNDLLAAIASANSPEELDALIARSAGAGA